MVGEKCGFVCLFESTHGNARKDLPAQHVDVKLVDAIIGTDNTKRAIGSASNIIREPASLDTHRTRPSSLHAKPAVSSCWCSTRPMFDMATRSTSRVRFVRG